MNVVNWIKEGNRIERIILLAQIEFKLMYYGNKLGLFWALANPISQIFVYYIMFEVLMESKIDNFAVYVFSGLFIWIFFTTVSGRSVGLLKTKSQLFEHTNMSKMELYFAQILSGTIGLLFNFAVFIITSLWYGVMPSFYYLYFPLVYFNLVILTLGVSLILSNIFLLFRDIQQLWNIIVRFAFFLSPILFKGDLFQKKVPVLIYLNPMSGIINNTRNILIYQKHPDWFMLSFDFTYAIFILLIGIFMLNKISSRASELI